MESLNSLYELLNSSENYYENINLLDDFTTTEITDAHFPQKNNEDNFMEFLSDNNKTPSTNYESKPLSQNEDKFNIDLKIINEKIEENTFEKEKELTETVSIVSETEDFNIFNVDYVPIKKEKPKPEVLTARKMADDSIRKKLKTNLENKINKQINLYLATKYKNEDNITFKKKPQNFLKNVTIKLNKQCLEMTLEELYLKDFGDKSKKKLINNSKVIKNLRQNHPEEFEEGKILRMKWKDLINDYLQSSKYKQDLENIRNFDGDVYAENFDRLVRGNKKIFGFVEYYLRTPANNKKQNK